MKRLIVLMCAALMTAASLASCGEANIQTEQSTPDTKIPQISQADSTNAQEATELNNGSAVKGKVSDGLKVEPITYFTEYGDYIYLLVTNESDKDCDLSISLDLYKDGNIVNTTYSSVDAVAKGTTVVDDFYIEDEFDNYDYRVVASDLTYTIPVDQDLELKTETEQNKVKVSITNNGKLTAMYVGYDVFFYKEGKLIGHSYNYCCDKDNEIKPGATEKSNCSCYVDGGFDDVKVYFHGEYYES